MLTVSPFSQAKVECVGFDAVSKKNVSRRSVFLCLPSALRRAFHRARAREGGGASAPSPCSRHSIG